MYDQLAKQAWKIANSLQDLQATPISDPILELRLMLIHQKAIDLAKEAEIRARRNRHPVIERRHLKRELPKRV